MAARAEAREVEEQNMGHQAHAGDIDHACEAPQPPSPRRRADTICAARDATEPALAALVRLLARLAAREAWDGAQAHPGDPPGAATDVEDLPSPATPL